MRLSAALVVASALAGLALIADAADAADAAGADGAAGAAGTVVEAGDAGAAANAVDAGDADLDALRLADRAAAAPVDKARDWRASIETAAGVLGTAAGNRVGVARLSADLRYDAAPAPGWRWVLADRLDLSRRWEPVDDTRTNTLKELYLSWRPAQQASLELGRINLRNGAAMGYNPTDFFKADAARSITTLDPSSLRENRLGTGMLRGQWLGAGGTSLSALVAPKLADAPSDGDFSPDWGATNRGQRWLLAGGLPQARGLSTQLLLYGGEGLATQAGLNLSYLATDSTVAFVELSAGRMASMRSTLDGVDGVDGDERWRSRLATGFTHTTPGNVSFTLEYDYNGAAVDAEGFRQLARSPNGLLARYLGLAASQQDLAVRQGLFAYLSWQNAFVRLLDLNVMQRLDLERHSRLSWAELRYHFDRIDLALQWQRYSGAADSVYGAMPTHYATQLLMRVYF